MEKYFTCMWCGFEVFQEVFSDYEICPICGFQDCFWAMEFPLEQYFEYWHSLLDIQKSVLEKSVDTAFYIKNPHWRMIDESKINPKHPYFPKWKYDEFISKYWENKSFLESLIEAEKYNWDL
jgi:hypothetical protein